MTPTSGMLAVFASKNKQVVQIRIQVSHVEAVSSLAEFDIYAYEYRNNDINTNVKG